MSANIPDFRLTLEGRDLRGAVFGTAAELLDITARVRPRLIGLTLTEKRGDEADQLDITLDDSDGKLEMPKPGAVLRLQLGWRQGRDVTAGLVDKGSFKVDEVEHGGPPDQIRITARSADFTSDLKARREKSWHDTTLGAVVSEIAGRNGLQPRCPAALASIPLASVVQSRESDMALLRRLGREYDAVATIKAGALIVMPIGAGETPTGKPLAEITLRRRDGDRHSYRLAKRDDGEGVTASWHDRKAARRQRDVYSADHPNGEDRDPQARRPGNRSSHLLPLLRHPLRRCSTGVAAIRAGQRFAGIEHNPTYFKNAVERISAAVDQFAQGKAS